jgi:DNA-binding NarL/FixJ family response regulator
LNSRHQRNIFQNSEGSSSYTTFGDSYLERGLRPIEGDLASTQADIIERLMNLAASIASESQDRLLLQRFIWLLEALLETFEAKISSLSPSPCNIKNTENLRTIVSMLTERQGEVLRLRATGLSVREIAGQLSLTPSTVQSHIRDDIKRLGVSGGIMAAVAEAHARRLI